MLTADHQALFRIADADREALDAFYDEHSALVWAFCLRLGDSKAEAEHLLTCVFRQVWAEPCKLMDADCVSQGLIAMTIRICAQRRTARARRVRAGDCGCTPIPG
jgi:DNA-directed RNA polymerase specialized sigma24 family protein